MRNHSLNAEGKKDAAARSTVYPFIGGGIRKVALTLLEAIFQGFVASAGLRPRTVTLAVLFALR